MIRINDYFIKHFFDPEVVQSNYSFNINAVIKDDQGSIWLGTDNGLIHYDPALQAARLRPPVPEVISVKINEHEIPVSPIINLKPGIYKIQIDYIAVDLRQPGEMIYKIRLEGRDELFETTQSKSVTYQNLSNGEYRLFLHAINGDGVMSEKPFILQFVIKTPLNKQWWFFPALGMALVMITFIYFIGREHSLTHEKRKLEEKVRERTVEIEEQKSKLEIQRDLITTKNVEITASIRYALKIQKAVLPSQDLLTGFFPDHFIFIKPKDIVSGDFYWLTQKNDKIIFTVADCTGHGVPGAFMSMLSVTMLNEIVNIEGLTRSDLIVNRLHSMINISLNQSKMDGLDLSLCVYDRKKKQIQYTGALNQLVYIRNGLLEVIKADHFSVNSIREDFTSFSLNEVDVQQNDVFYLFSDGYMDQFGGELDKKYSVKRFYETLLEIHQLPMEQQATMLEEKLNAWKKDTVQTDDITVLGIRFRDL